MRYALNMVLKRKLLYNQGAVLLMSLGMWRSTLCVIFEGRDSTGLAMMFQVRKYSTVSSICTRLEERMKEERELEKRITMLREIIRKRSQAKI